MNLNEMLTTLAACLQSCSHVTVLSTAGNHNTAEFVTFEIGSSVAQASLKLVMYQKDVPEFLLILMDMWFYAVLGTQLCAYLANTVSTTHPAFTIFIYLNIKK